MRVVGTKKCANPKYVVLKQPGQLFWWAHATYWKLCLCLQKGGCLYPSNCCVSQLVPTTLNDHTLRQFTNNKEWRLIMLTWLKNHWTILQCYKMCVSFISIYVCNVSQWLCKYYEHVHIHLFTYLNTMVLCVLSCRNAFKVVHMYRRHHWRTF